MKRPTKLLIVLVLSVFTVNFSANAAFINLNEQLLNLHEQLPVSPIEPCTMILGTSKLDESTLAPQDPWKTARNLALGWSTFMKVASLGYGESSFREVLIRWINIQQARTLGPQKTILTIPALQSFTNEWAKNQSPFDASEMDPIELREKLLYLVLELVRHIYQETDVKAEFNDSERIALRNVILTAAANYDAQWIADWEKAMEKSRRR